MDLTIDRFKNPLEVKKIELTDEDLYDITKKSMHEHIHMQHTCFEPKISQ